MYFEHDELHKSFRFFAAAIDDRPHRKGPALL